MSGRREGYDLLFNGCKQESRSTMGSIHKDLSSVDVEEEG
jgi:hypothetical protein